MLKLFRTIILKDVLFYKNDLGIINDNLDNLVLEIIKIIKIINSNTDISLTKQVNYKC